VHEHNGKRNVYYSTNPTRSNILKKAAKTDIAAIEYLLADLDPAKDEMPEAAKARYRRQLNTFEPKPTAIVDSGNGIQCLWKLAQPVVLGEPLKTMDDKGKPKLVFSPEDKAKIHDIETGTAALMVRLGAEAGTQNIDRILRLPGTINLPNGVKRKKGRVCCPTKLLAFNGASYPLELFVPGTPDDGGHHARQDHADNEPTKGRATVDVDALSVSDRIKNLIRGINDPEHVYKSRSEQVFAVIMAMVKAKCADQQIQDLMFDKRLTMGDHVREQPNPADYLVRQIRHALAKIDGPDAVVREVKIKARMEDVLKSAEALRTKIFEPLRLIRAEVFARRPHTPGRQTKNWKILASPRYRRWCVRRRQVPWATVRTGRRPRTHA
jgi:hypothetical protein